MSKYSFSLAGLRGLWTPTFLAAPLIIYACVMSYGQNEAAAQSSQDHSTGLIQLPGEEAAIVSGPVSPLLAGQGKRQIETDIIEVALPRDLAMSDALVIRAQDLIDDMTPPARAQLVADIAKITATPEYRRAPKGAATVLYLVGLQQLEQQENSAALVALAQEQKKVLAMPAPDAAAKKERQDKLAALQAQTKELTTTAQKFAKIFAPLFTRAQSQAIKQSFSQKHKSLTPKMIMADYQIARASAEKATVEAAELGELFGPRGIVKEVSGYFKMDPTIMAAIFMREAFLGSGQGCDPTGPCEISQLMPKTFIGYLKAMSDIKKRGASPGNIYQAGVLEALGKNEKLRKLVAAYEVYAKHPTDDLKEELLAQRANRKINAIIGAAIVAETRENYPGINFMMTSLFYIVGAGAEGVMAAVQNDPGAWNDSAVYLQNIPVGYLRANPLLGSTPSDFREECVSRWQRGKDMLARYSGYVVDENRALPERTISVPVHNRQLAAHSNG